MANVDPSVTPLRADPNSAHPHSTPPAGAFLCDAGDGVPAGWRQSPPAPGTNVCVAFDPSRHTVVRNMDRANNSELAAAMDRAGFARFQVPGAQTGFFVRDRSAQPTRRRQPAQQGMSR